MCVILKSVDLNLLLNNLDSIGISDKGLFWGRGHLMTLGGAFLALQVLPPRLPGLVHHPSPGSENAGLNGGERSHQPGPPAAPGGSDSP